MSGSAISAVIIAASASIAASSLNAERTALEQRLAVAAAAMQFDPPGEVAQWGNWGNWMNGFNNWRNW